MQTDDGGYLIATGANVHKQPNNVLDSFECFLIKTDANGKVEWSKNYFANALCSINDLKKTKDGNYVFTSINKVTESGAGGDSSYIVKIDRTGEVLWSGYLYNTTGIVYVHDVVSTSDSGYLLTGEQSNGNLPGSFITKLDSAGKTVWSKSTPANSVCYTAAEANNGDCIAAGGIVLNKKSYYYFTDVDKKGVQQWSKLIYSSNVNTAPDVSVFSLMNTSDHATWQPALTLRM